MEMKIQNLLMLLMLSYCLSSCSWFVKDPVKEKAKEQSYLLGLQFSRSVKKQNTNLIEAEFLRGIEDGLSNKEGLPTDEAISKVMTQIMIDRVSSKNAAAMKLESDFKNYLTENKKRKNVQEINSEVQVEILKAGTGKLPQTEDRVELKMRMQSTTGVEFEKDEQPREYSMLELLPGVRDGLRVVPAGSLVRIFTSSMRGFGMRGNQQIPPGSGLIVDVEFIKIIQKPQAKKPHL